MGKNSRLSTALYVTGPAGAGPSRCAQRVRTMRTVVPSGPLMSPRTCRVGTRHMQHNTHTYHTRRPPNRLPACHNMGTSAPAPGAGLGSETSTYEPMACTTSS